MYNQLLKNKAAMDEKNKKLLQEVEDQKAKILKMEGALTYVEDQLTELQTNQNTCPLLLTHNPPPPPNSSQQSILLPLDTPSDATTAGKSKKIVIVLDPLIFKEKIDEKDILYNHWLLQIRNNMIANKKMISTDTLKKIYIYRAELVAMHWPSWNLASEKIPQTYLQQLIRCLKL